MGSSPLRVCALAAALGLIPAVEPVTAQLSASTAPADAVAVTVNGHPILESEVDDRFLSLVAEQTGGAMLPPEELASIMESLHDDLIEMLIDDYLLDSAADAAGIDLTPSEVRAEIEREVDGFLVKSGATRAEFAERVEETDGLTLDEFLSGRAADPIYVRGMRHARLMDHRFPLRTAVSDEEIAARYAEELADVYERPELVRARHILVSCEQDAADEEVTAARERADRLLGLARADDADFAELARDNSDDGSSVAGGDLGFFPRDGIPFEAFTDAAFGLEPGQVSDPVRTEYGFHIIQCVAHKPAEVVSLDAASASIRLELHWEKLDAVRLELITELRDTADIQPG